LIKLQEYLETVTEIPGNQVDNYLPRTEELVEITKLQVREPPNLRNPEEIRTDLLQQIDWLSGYFRDEYSKATLAQYRAKIIEVSELTLQDRTEILEEISWYALRDGFDPSSMRPREEDLLRMKLADKCQELARYGETEGIRETYKKKLSEVLRTQCH